MRIPSRARLAPPLPSRRQLSRRRLAPRCLGAARSRAHVQSPCARFGYPGHTAIERQERAQRPTGPRLAARLTLTQAN